MTNVLHNPFSPENGHPHNGGLLFEGVGKRMRVRVLSTELALAAMINESGKLKFVLSQTEQPAGGAAVSRALQENTPVQTLTTVGVDKPEVILDALSAKRLVDAIHDNDYASPSLDVDPEANTREEIDVAA